MITKDRVLLPRGSVPVARFILTGLLCAVVAVALPVIYVIVRSGGESPGVVFTALTIVSPLMGVPGAWICWVVALRGTQTAPIATIRRDLIGTTITGFNALGLPRRPAMLDAAHPVHVFVKLFLEQAEGTSKKRLVRVMLIEVGQGDRLLARSRCMATPGASAVDWRTWAAQAFSAAPALDVHVRDTTQKAAP